MCTCNKKEPEFRRKWRENAHSLTRYFGKFVSHSDQKIKFDRFKAHRELVKKFEHVEIERLLEFFSAAGVIDPFDHLVQLDRDNISITALSRIAAKRVRLAG